MAQNGHAKPVLVSTGWLAERLGDEGFVVVEATRARSCTRRDTFAGAVQLRWQRRPPGPSRAGPRRSPETFERLLGERGIGNDTPVVLYGDRNNWFAASAYWCLKVYGHSDARILDGGRQKWIDEGRQLTTEAPSRGRGLQAEGAGQLDSGLPLPGDRVARRPRAGRSSTSARRPSSRASSSPRPATSRRARSGPATSRQPCPFPGRAPCATTARSGPRRSFARCTPATGSPQTGASPPTAGSANARRTPGSFCGAARLRAGARTTTARGRSGAISSTCRSSARRPRAPARAGARWPARSAARSCARAEARAADRGAPRPSRRRRAPRRRATRSHPAPRRPRSPRRSGGARSR